MIRKHEPADLEAILAVWYQASTLAHPFLEEAFVEMVKKAMREVYVPDSETWVYEEKEEVVGFISMLGNEIGGLFILPGNQGKRIGTQLVDFVQPSHPILEVEVFAKNAIGYPFYEKYGFQVMKTYLQEESGQEVVRMSFRKN